MNPTYFGILSIVVWSTSLAVNKFLNAEIGALATVGTIAAVSGFLALLKTRLKGFNRDVWSNKFLWLRWFLFVFHLAVLYTGVRIVSTHHMPFMVLCNYLWPTMILLLSVGRAGVKITRRAAFICGTIIVIASMAIEIVGPAGLRDDLFALPSDCFAYLCALTAALCWAAYSVLSRLTGGSSGGSSAVPLFQLTVGLALPISLLPGIHVPWEISLRGALLLAGFSIGQFVALLCWDHAIRKGVWSH